MLCHNPPLHNKPKGELFCDSCDKGYHMLCHNPPLHNKPKGELFCDSCDKGYHMLCHCSVIL